MNHRAIMLLTWTYPLFFITLSARCQEPKLTKEHCSCLLKAIEEQYPEFLHQEILYIKYQGQKRCSGKFKEVGGAWFVPNQNTMVLVLDSLSATSDIARLNFSLLRYATNDKTLSIVDAGGGYVEFNPSLTKAEHCIKSFFWE